MTELLLVVCLLADPSQCQQQSLLYMDGSPRECMMDAQTELAKWVAVHPNVSIQSWKCQTVFSDQKA